MIEVREVYTGDTLMVWQHRLHSERYTFSKRSDLILFEILEIGDDCESDSVEFWAPPDCDPILFLKGIIKRYEGFGFNSYSEFELDSNMFNYLSKYIPTIKSGNYTLTQAVSVLEHTAYCFRKLSELYHSLELENYLEFVKTYKQKAKT